MTPVIATRTPGAQRQRTPPVNPPSSHEQSGSGQRLLCGDRQLGVVVRWHEFPEVPMTGWSQTVAKETLVLCLNLLGGGTARGATAALDFEVGTAGVFFTHNRDFELVRHAGKRHRFVTLEFSAAWLRRHLSPCDGALTPNVEAFLAGHGYPATRRAAPKMTGEQEACAKRLGQPPVFHRARELWYQGQILQLMAEYFFERPDEDELFCDRQKRLAHERTQKVKAILQRDLINPPNLETIGQEVGCSAFYLSRTFSQAAGMTIPQYLRKLRIERAAELLQTGKYNVTEAALEVGYSSLSHFSQAFCQTMGCCPGLYPVKTATQRQ